MNTVEWFQFQI